MENQSKSLEQKYLLNYADLKKHFAWISKEEGHEEEIARFHMLESKMANYHKAKIKCKKIFCNKPAVFLTLKAALFMKDYKEPHYWCAEHFGKNPDRTFTIRGPISFHYSTNISSKSSQEKFCASVRKAFGLGTVTKNVAKEFFSKINV